MWRLDGTTWFQLCNNFSSKKLLYGVGLYDLDQSLCNTNLIFLINLTLWHAFCTGVTTIAGGKRGYAGGHVDGPSEDAKFSNDFDVVYVCSSCSLLVVDCSSCSLLVVDRGDHAIREIQLHQDDCTSYDEDDNSFNLGMIHL